MSEFSSEQSKMTLRFAWADDVISSRSCAVKLLQTSTASFSHGSPIPGRDLTLNDKELKIENQRNLPGPQPSLVLNRMPAEIVSNTRRRASPAESGVPALKAALSTINSIAYTRIRITSLAEPNLYFFIFFLLPRVPDSTRQANAYRNPSWPWLLGRNFEEYWL